MAAAERVQTHRRYCFLKYRQRFREWNWPLADGWNAKRLAEPGTELPPSFPAYSALLAGHYLVLEEVQGASATELINAGLTAEQAAAVLAALE